MFPFCVRSAASGLYAWDNQPKKFKQFNFPGIQITDLYGSLSLTLNFDLEGDL